jgi:raffinose/stachyose/melibiose transport system permease protein
VSRLASETHDTAVPTGGARLDARSRNARGGVGPRRSRRANPLRPASLGRGLSVLLLLVFYLFPLLFLLNTALKSNAAFDADPIGLVTSPDFGNFATAWERGDFAAYIGNSILYTAAAALIGTFVSVLMAFPVSRGYLRGSRWWQLAFVLLLFLPNAIITQFQLLLRLGLYDTQLGYILIMGACIGVGPILLTGYFKSIPRELDEAAAVDGVTYWRYLFTFVVPLGRPAIATVFILQAIGVWNDIILATILLPDSGKSPLTLGLFAFQGTYTSQWGLLAAATMIVAAPLVAAYVFLQRYLVSGALGGAIKG